jgi:hypothetical protein
MSPSKKGAASIESFASVRRTASALMKQRKLFSADLKNFTASLPAHTTPAASYFARGQGKAFI